MKINEETNLPDLSEFGDDYYWEISRGDKDNPYLEGLVTVTMMRKPKKPNGNRFQKYWLSGYSPTRVAWRGKFVEGIQKFIDDPDRPDINSFQDWVINVCYMIIEDERERLRESSLSNTIDNYVGTYPPKRFN